MYHKNIGMTATCDEIPSLNKTLTASVTELTENEPPDPTYYDRDDGFQLHASNQTRQYHLSLSNYFIARLKVFAIFYFIDNKGDKIIFKVS